MSKTKVERLRCLFETPEIQQMYIRLPENYLNNSVQDKIIAEAREISKLGNWNTNEGLKKILKYIIEELAKSQKYSFGKEMFRKTVESLL